MICDVFMAGFGGQGVLMAGNLLAAAAMIEGKSPCYFPAYGVEKRGGAATCTVIISDGEVGSPVVGRPGALLAFNQLSVEKYFPLVRKGGFCLLNASMLEEVPERADLHILSLPLNDLAQEVGDPRLVNMIALGAFAERSGAVRAASLKEALRRVLPEHRHHLIPLNAEAIDRGGAEARKGILNTTADT